MSDDFKLFPDGANFNGVLPFALIQATDSPDQKQLRWLLDDANSVGGIGGDPGWSIDRRKPSIDVSEYADWPDWAEYCVQVPESEVTFDLQLEFVTRERFENCLRQVLAAKSIAIGPIEEIWGRNAANKANPVALIPKYDVATVREWLTQQPFQPFRLRMSNGLEFEIHDPQKALLNKTDVMLAVEPTNGKVAAGMSLCLLLQIVSIEPLNSGIASGDA